MEECSRTSEIILSTLPLLRKKLMRFDEEYGGGVMIPAHVQILSLLQNEGPLTVSTIGNKLLIAKPNITPPLNRLYASGFIIRKFDESDRRTIIVSITEEGSKYLFEYINKVDNFISDKLNNLSEDELKEFIAALERVQKVLYNIL